MSTFQTIQDQVSYNLGGRNDPATLAQIMFQTNFVMKLMAAAHEWEDLQATASPSLVIGTYEYTDSTLSLVNPQRIYAIELYRDSRWQPPMTEVSERVWRTKYAPSVVASGGPPTIVSRYAQKYFFYPKPDATDVLRIEYLKKAVAVTGVNSTIPFTDKDELIVALTTGVMWLAVGELALASKWISFATPLIEQFNVDSGRILNFISPGNRSLSAGSQPWLDPFVRRT